MSVREACPRKVREGVVVSNKMQKTVTVRVERVMRHPEFSKVVRRWKKYYAHVEQETPIAVGTRVRIIETRPLSKLKCWRVTEVLAAAKEVVGEEVGS